MRILPPRNARARFSPNPSSYLRSLLAGLRHRRVFAGVEAYCMFLGHPRSGHTLTGSLLDAHPDAVLSHELDALEFVRSRYARSQLFSLIVQRSRWFANRDFEWQGYSYRVPGGWQGRFRSLKVLGDKKASKSTATLRREPELLGRLRQVVGVPLRIIHVVRNPFDNIARMALQSGGDLSSKSDFYFRLCATVEAIRETCSEGEFISVRHEEFIADPEEALRRLCLFLGLEAEGGYLEACTGIVFRSPRRARDKVAWERGVVQDVAARMGAFEFLSGYRFDS